MRQKIKMNLGGIPPIGPQGPVRTNWAPRPGGSLDFMPGMGMIQPGPVTSGTYGMFPKQLQPLGSAPLDALNKVGNFNLGQVGGSGGGMGGVHQGLGMLEQELAMPKNEFDQAQSTITKAKKAGNLIARGRDAVQHARNVKKVADVANASSDVSSLLGNLSAQGAGEVAKQGAKTGVGQFIANAGASKMGTFLSSGAGAAASAGVGILGKAIQELDKKDGNFSRAGAMGGGALQGAAIGSALGPIGTVAGAAIGAGIGAMQRKKFEQNAISQDLTKKTDTAVADARSRLAGRSILKSFPVEGIKEQVYAYGGPTGGQTNNPDYLAEGGEMIQHAPGDLPKTDSNGSVTPVTKTIARINGDKHIAASGGVGMEGDKPARIYSDQLTVPAELRKQLSRL